MTRQEAGAAAFGLEAGGGGTDLVVVMVVVVVVVVVSIIHLSDQLLNDEAEKL